MVECPEVNMGDREGIGSQAFFFCECLIAIPQRYFLDPLPTYDGFFLFGSAEG